MYCRFFNVVFVMFYKNQVFWFRGEGAITPLIAPPLGFSLAIRRSKY